VSSVQSDKKSPRRLIIIILSVTLAISAGVMVVQRIQGKIGHKTYDEALEIATQAEPSPKVKLDSKNINYGSKDVPNVSDPRVFYTLSEINLPALQNVNADVLGWLYIPNASISYPFMRSEDNEFYLDHDWQGEKYIDGAIYVDYRNSMDGMDFNTIIYGHNKEDGFMFSNLVNYKKQDFYAANPYIYLHTPGGIFRYRVFSAHELEANGYAYQLRTVSAETFIAESMKRSIIQTDVEVTPADRVITLSTCNGYLSNTRFVVQAVLDAMITE